jgi:threonine dehydratase
VLADLVEQTGAIVVHPYNDERIVAGQGTCAKELMEDEPNLDIIVCPVSGGGLLGGTLIAAKGINPNIIVFGAEPSEADDAYRSLKSGKIETNKSIDTICDGLRAQIGTITFPIIQKYVDGIITVTETEIIEAMRMVWERMKIIAEPSSAIALGAILKSPSNFEGKRVGLIISGGNVDLKQLPW